MMDTHTSRNSSVPSPFNKWMLYGLYVPQNENFFVVLFSNEKVKSKQKQQQQQKIVGRTDIYLSNTTFIPAYWFIKLCFGVCTLGSIPLQCELFPSNQANERMNKQTSTCWNFVGNRMKKREWNKNSKTATKKRWRVDFLSTNFNVCNLQAVDRFDKKLNCLG